MESSHNGSHEERRHAPPQLRRNGIEELAAGHQQDALPDEIVSGNEARYARCRSGVECGDGNGAGVEEDGFGVAAEADLGSILIEENSMKLNLVQLEDRHTPSPLITLTGQLYENEYTHTINFISLPLGSGEHYRANLYHLRYRSNFIRGEATAFGEMEARVTITGRVYGHTLYIRTIQFNGVS